MSESILREVLEPVLLVAVAVVAFAAGVELANRDDVRTFKLVRTASMLESGEPRACVVRAPDEQAAREAAAHWHRSPHWTNDAAVACFAVEPGPVEVLVTSYAP